MKLLYLNEHLSCLNYQMNSDVGFTCQQLEKDEVYRIDNSKSSCTLFMIEGDVILIWVNIKVYEFYRTRWCSFHKT